MNMVGNKHEYVKVYDKRTKLFGIKEEGAKGWYVEPWFEELGMREFSMPVKSTWFKKDGAYGMYDVEERRVLIPAEYGFPPYLNRFNGCAVTWKDHKAGVIDSEGKEVIPFKYDEIQPRFQRVDIPEEERITVKDEEGNERKVGPTTRDVLRGYACFTNEGGEQAYDEKGNPAQFEEWEQELMHSLREYENQEVGSMNLKDLEEWIRKEYVALLELGYDLRQKYTCSSEHCKKVDEQEEKVRSLIRDRRRMMNSTWVHNLENAKHISRVNDLLMRAVRKAIKLGAKTTKSLQWMEKVPNSYHYVVDVFVHPLWQNSKSDYRYECKFKTASKENDRLIDDEDNLAPTHIWNIIATVGNGTKKDGMAQCFHYSADEYRKGAWNVRDLIHDDGQTWDEGFHFPAYQDVYFTMPFNDFAFDLFDYSLEDLCNINDFRVNVNVRLETREQGNRY